MTLFSLSGHVNRPGQYEAPMGITLRELLDLSGGVRNGHQLKFWTPGGSSTPILTAEHLDVPMSYEGIVGAGSMLGTKALQIFDETTCVVRAVLRWTEFYAHESCGKCTPAERAPSGSCRSCAGSETARAATRTSRSCSTSRTTSSPVVLRAGRRCDQPDHVVHPVLQDEYLAHIRAPWLARSTGRLDAVRDGRAGRLVCRRRTR
jgi:hypothetical protein